MKTKRPSSHYILFTLLVIVLIGGSYSSVMLTKKVKNLAETVSSNMRNTMDPKAPDPGKTKSEKYEVGPKTKKVKIKPINPRNYLLKTTNLMKFNNKNIERNINEFTKSLLQ